jgi:hypothetical protein
MLTPRAGDGREPRRAGVPNPASPRAAASPPARAEWRRGTQPHRPPSSKQAHRKPARQRPSQISARDILAGETASPAPGTCPQLRALPARRPSSPSSRGVQKLRPRNSRPVVDHIRRASFLRPPAHRAGTDLSPPALDQAFATWTICIPMPLAAAVTSRSVLSVVMALAGLTSTATRVAAGTSSRRSSSRFAVTSPL